MRPSVRTSRRMPRRRIRSRAPGLAARRVAADAARRPSCAAADRSTSSSRTLEPATRRASPSATARWPARIVATALAPARHDPPSARPDPRARRCLPTRRRVERRAPRSAPRRSSSSTCPTTPPSISRCDSSRRPPRRALRRPRQCRAAPPRPRADAIARRDVDTHRAQHARLAAGALDADLWRGDGARDRAGASATEPALDLTVKATLRDWADALGGIVLPTGSVRADRARAGRGAARLCRRRLVGAGRRRRAARRACSAMSRGKRVADLCAAPGGKTAQLAQRWAPASPRSIAREPGSTRLRQISRALSLRAETVAADVTALAAPDRSTPSCSTRPAPRPAPSAAIPTFPGSSAKATRRARHAAGRAARRCGRNAEAGRHARLLHLLARAGGRRGQSPQPPGARSAAAPPSVDGRGDRRLGEASRATGDLRTLPCHLPRSDPRLSGLDGFYAARLSASNQACLRTVAFGRIPAYLTDNAPADPDARWTGQASGVVAPDGATAYGRSAVDVARFSRRAGQTVRCLLARAMLARCLAFQLPAASSIRWRYCPGRCRTAADRADRPAHGRSHRAARHLCRPLRFLRRGVICDGRSPFDVEPPNEEWARQLHGFGWLRHLRATDMAISRSNARSLVDEWIALQGAATRSPGSRRSLSRRIISWLSQTPLVLDGCDLAFYRRFMRSLNRAGALPPPHRLDGRARACRGCRS